MEGRHALIRLEITQKKDGHLYSALLVSATSSKYCLELILLPGTSTAPGQSRSRLFDVTGWNPVAW